MTCGVFMQELFLADDDASLKGRSLRPTTSRPAYACRSRGPGSTNLVNAVVFCDNSLNRIELKQRARQYPSWGTVIEATDMSMLARAIGCDGVDVDSVKGREAALAGSRAKDRPLVIGAIDPAQYAAQFSAGLAEKPAAAGIADPDPDPGQSDRL